MPNFASIVESLKSPLASITLSKIRTNEGKAPALQFISTHLQVKTHDAMLPGKDGGKHMSCTSRDSWCSKIDFTKDKSFSL
jgi:hypothetical protein